MKCVFLSIICALMFIITNAQQNESMTFTCIDLTQTLSKWDSIHKSCENIKEKEFNNVWAKKVKDNFNFINGSKIEISFILSSEKTHDINSLMDASLDFLCDKFKVVDHNKGSERNRTTLKDNETKSIYFQGVIEKTATWSSAAEHYIHTDIIFKIKFKENKIKVIVTIPNYNYKYFNTTAAFLVGAGNYQDKNLSIIKLPPFEYENCPGSPGTNRNLKYANFFCSAYINSCSYILNYIDQYLKYLNSIDLDW